MSEFRWPSRECYHHNVSFSLGIELDTGRVIVVEPARCVDCGLEFEDV